MTREAVIFEIEIKDDDDEYNDGDDGDDNVLTVLSRCCVVRHESFALADSKRRGGTWRGEGVEERRGGERRRIEGKRKDGKRREKEIDGVGEKRKEGKRWEKKGK